MAVTIVVAASLDRVIGRDNGLPWHLPGDLKRFRARTIDRTVVMGRRTWESIGATPLKRRRNIVVTKTPGYQASGAEVVASLADALALASGDDIVIVGGAGVYQEAMPLADRIILSLVHTRVPDGHVFLPDVGRDWVIAEETAHDDAIPVTDFTLERPVGANDPRPRFVWPAANDDPDAVVI